MVGLRIQGIGAGSSVRVYIGIMSLCHARSPQCLGVEYVPQFGVLGNRGQSWVQMKKGPAQARTEADGWRCHGIGLVLMTTLIYTYSPPLST